MNNPLSIKKIYVDSRYKISGNSSNFKIELSQSITLPEQCNFQIDDVAISHSWYTIEENINDTIYIHVSNNNPNPDIRSSHPFVGKLTPGNYSGETLTIELQRVLNLTYNNLNFNGKFTVSFNRNTNTINIIINSIEEYFRILTDEVLSNKMDGFFDATYDKRNPASLNDIFRNYIDKGYVKNYTTEFLDLQPIQNIFISSPNLGSFNTMGARGESNIIKKIPVSSDFGFMIIDTITSNHDYLDCSRLSLKTLEFHLKDVKGRYIPLHGSHVSFSIIFSTVKEDF